MRKESVKIAKAFLARKAAKAARTSTNGTTLWLHGHAIAWHENGEIKATLAGWGTVTTRDRLNTLSRIMGKGARFNQSKGWQYFDGQEIATGDVVTL